MIPHLSCVRCPGVGVIVTAALVGAASIRGETPLRGGTFPSDQERPPVLSRDVVLEDFGVRSSAEVGRGRVSVVFAPEGTRLDVHYLRELGETPPVSAPRSPGAAAGAGLEPVSEPDLPPAARAVGTGAAPAQPLVALWVWSTQELLDDAAARAEFLRFVEAQGIDRVFLQLVPAAGAASAAGFVPFDGALTGRLVADLRARGALTYALDGDPRYVRTENREGVLRTVARVAEHNRGAPPEQRFVGVRYDIEPYLLPGFQGPRRGEILAQYLTVVEALSRAARGAGLAFGVDVPFWLDALDEVTGEPFEAVEGGARTPVLGRVLELADDVAVMAYRTVAGGPDGVLEHARGELGRAASEDVGVFVGLETAQLPDERLFSFRGAGRVGLPTLPDAAWVVLEERPGGGARVWLVEGAQALSELERATSDARSLTHWFAGSPVPLAGDALSFHALGAEAMRRVAGEVLEGFGGEAAFRGLAYHDYEGLRDLLEGR